MAFPGLAGAVVRLEAVVDFRFGPAAAAVPLVEGALPLSRLHLLLIFGGSQALGLTFVYGLVRWFHGPAACMRIKSTPV